MSSKLNVTLAVIAVSTAVLIAPSLAQPNSNSADAVSGATSDGASVNKGADVNAGAAVSSGSAGADTSDHSVTGYGGTRLQDLLNDASEPSNVASILPTNVSGAAQNRSDIGTLRATQQLNRAQ